MLLGRGSFTITGLGRHRTFSWSRYFSISFIKHFYIFKTEFCQVIETLKRYAFKEIIKLVKRSKIRNLASMVEDWFVENVLDVFFYKQ